MSHRVHTMLRRFVLFGIIATVVSTANLLIAGAAQAAPRPQPTATTRVYAAQAAADALRLRGRTIVAAARAQRGKPYRHGAQGPGAFDCSGLTGYAYRAANIRLPRTAAAQYRLARPVAKAATRPGDLVFWVSGGHAYHVAVYAGAGRVWHAPKPGDRVKLAKIWSAGQVRFGRIGH